MPNEPCGDYECITTKQRRWLEDEIGRLKEGLAAVQAHSVAVADYEALVKELDEAVAACEDMRDLLEDVDTATDGEELGFALAAVREYLKDHKCVSRKDAALAQMRGALEEASRGFRVVAEFLRTKCLVDEEEQAFQTLINHLAICADNTKAKCDAALSSSLGASTLEYIKAIDTYLKGGESPVSAVLDCAQPGVTADGKCVGYQRSADDDEPCEQCKVCPKNQFYETIDTHLKGAGK